MEGHTSDWFTQHTDVHSTTDEDRLHRARVSTATFTEVLFADDTICITSTPSAMNDLLACIERVGWFFRTGPGSPYKLKLDT
eukprot:9487826-Karenia_brevis.AAC.1